MYKQCEKLVHENRGTKLKHSVPKYIEVPVCHCANKRIALITIIYADMFFPFGNYVNNIIYIRSLSV